jgi:hypothetical protein
LPAKRGSCTERGGRYRPPLVRLGCRGLSPGLCEGWPKPHPTPLGHELPAPTGQGTRCRPRLLPLIYLGLGYLSGPAPCRRRSGSADHCRLPCRCRPGIQPGPGPRPNARKASAKRAFFMVGDMISSPFRVDRPGFYKWLIAVVTAATVTGGVRGCGSRLQPGHRLLSSALRGASLFGRAYLTAVSDMRH